MARWFVVFGLVSLLLLFHHFSIRRKRCPLYRDWSVSKTALSREKEKKRKVFPIRLLKLRDAEAHVVLSLDPRYTAFSPFLRDQTRPDQPPNQRPFHHGILLTPRNPFQKRRKNIHLADILQVFDG